MTYQLQSQEYYQMHLGWSQVSNHLSNFMFRLERKKPIAKKDAKINQQNCKEYIRKIANRDAVLEQITNVLHKFSFHQ